MMMKQTMKKTAAILAAILMLVPAIPALAATYSSGIVIGGAEGYRETMEIVGSKGTYVLVGQTLELDVNEGYDSVKWTSENTELATIDENGLLTALQPGTVTITAAEGEYSASAVVTIVDPEPLMAEAKQAEETPETEPAGEPEGEPAGDQPEQPAGEPEDQPAPAPARKEYAIIVINGESTRYVYDGEEHTLDTFVATSNLDTFDESKVRAVTKFGVSATNCGTYELKLKETDFAYDDPNVIASFVVNNGWMKITPAQATVTVNAAEKERGQSDPEFTATVVGTYGEDTIEYTIERMPGEVVGEYIIDVTGEEKQGNYRVNFVAGILTINGEPEVTITSSLPAGQAVYAGTEITLKANPAGFGDAELTYQWEYSTDGANWTDIEGATQQTYTYVIMPENAMYRYRVFVNPVD